MNDIEPRGFGQGRRLGRSQVKVLRVGQCVEHGRYGVGIATESNEDRTTIDFYEHGPKKFVTEIGRASCRERV